MWPKGSVGFLTVFILLSGWTMAFAHGGPWHTPPDRWIEPRIYHTPFDEEFSGRVMVSKDTLFEPVVEKVFSPNGAYWFSRKAPEFSEEGPWNTSVWIFQEREYLLRISLLDHGNAQPDVKWINEKLLHIQVWWGKILGTSMIFDVEEENYIYKEMVHWGLIDFQQWHRDVKDEP